MSDVDVSGYNHSHSVRIDRPAADLYALVADIARMGELSPVCTTCKWDEAEAGARAGAWFTGTNSIGDLTWDTRCEVVAADPGREFAFVNYGPSGDAQLVRWGYLFEEDGQATTVTETWQVLPNYSAFLTGRDPGADVAARLDGMAVMARDGMRDTLANLKAVAES